MRGTVPLACLLVFCLSISALPLVGAHSDGLYLVITTDKEEYTVGDEIRLTVHSFHSGEYVDLDEPPLVEASLDNGTCKTSHRVDKGRYELFFNVTAADVQQRDYASFRFVQLGELEYSWDNYVATFERSNENDTTFDYVRSSDVGEIVVDLVDMGAPKGLSVEYELSDISDCPWGPGDTVPFVIKVTEGGSPVAPDRLMVELEWMNVSGREGYDPIGYVNRSAGVFDAELTIPSSIDVSEGAIVTISAIDGMEPVSTSFYLYLESYQVWVHWLPSMNVTTRVFDLHVSDPQGRVVPNAEVGLETYDRDSSDRTYRSITDMEGKATFTVEGVIDSIWFQGWLIVGGSNISFDGVLEPLQDEDQDQPMEEPSGYGFDVIQGEMKGSKLDLFAYMDGEPLSSTDISYYASTGRAVKAYGKARTDDRGWFQMDLGSSPERYHYLHFMVPDGYHPGIFVGYNWSDSDEDGFSDLFEEEIGTDPGDPDDHPHGYIDSDMDGFGDDYEVWFGTDPEDPSEQPSTYNDTDGDGWGDEFEVANGTDPRSRSDVPGHFIDTDGDDHDDDEELFYGKDPLDPEDLPEDICSVNTDGDSVEYAYGWMEDEQYDEEEIFYGTDPFDPDDHPFDRFGNHSDRDGVCDEEEIFYGTDPEDPNDDPNYVPYPWDERYSDHNSTDGLWYEYDYDFHYSSGGSIDLGNKDITIDIDRLTVGGRTTITLTSSKEAVGFLCAVIPGNMDVVNSIIEGGELEWEPLMGDEIIVPVYRTKDGWKGVLVLPGFLPKGYQEYTILAGAGTEEGAISFAHVTLRDGESGGSGEDDDDFSILWMFIVAAVILILVVVVIVIVLFLILSRKKAERSDTGKEGTKEEGPSADEILSSIPDIGGSIPPLPTQQPAPVVQTPPLQTVVGPEADSVAFQPPAPVQSGQAAVPAPPEGAPPAVEVALPSEEATAPQTTTEGPGAISFGPDLDAGPKKDGRIGIDDLFAD